MKNKLFLKKEALNEIEKQTNQAMRELEQEADKRNRQEIDDTQKENEAPCTVCGNKTFVLKYRDVNGKIEGHISGFFSLFGGSISGYVDGSISTAPVLSCRKCENERKIQLPTYITAKNIFSEQIPYVSAYSKNSDIDEKDFGDWIKSYGLEVAVALDSLLDCEYITDEGCLKKEESFFEKSGLKIKYPYKEWWEFWK